MFSPAAAAWASNEGNRLATQQAPTWRTSALYGFVNQKMFRAQATSWCSWMASVIEVASVRFL
jgi:hypothetical protein